MVRGKFKVYEKGERTSWNKEEPNPVFVKMSPVQGEPFGKYTPCGNIEMTIVNTEAAKQFEIGKEYYVDFSPAENVEITPQNVECCSQDTCEPTE